MKGTKLFCLSWKHLLQIENCSNHHIVKIKVVGNCLNFCKSLVVFVHHTLKNMNIEKTDFFSENQGF